MTELCFPLKYVSSARREHVCDGCMGEFRILPGGMYALHTVMEGGRFRRMRLCMRCVCAVAAKLKARRGKAFRVEPGGLRWQFLAAPFKRAWKEYLTHLLRQSQGLEPKDEDENRRLLENLGLEIKDVGVNDFAKRKEERKMRLIHREKQELARFRKAVREAVAEVARCQGEVAKAHVVGNVVAYGNATKLLVEALQRLEDLAKGKE